MDLLSFGIFGEPEEPKRKRKRKPNAENPVFRITCVGASSSGKTSLINAIVNNTFFEEYSPTHDIQLFYRLFRYDVQRGMEKNQSGTVMLELEDTFGSNRKGERFQIQRQLHNVRNIVELNNLRENIEEDNLDVTPFRPFSFTDFRKPCTPNRSAFFIVFDANELSSLQEAGRVLAILQEQTKKLAIRAMCPLPIIALIGTKIDENSETLNSVREAAEELAFVLVFDRNNCRDEKKVLFHFVSSLTYKGIQDMLSDIVKAILTTPGLWQIREEIESESSSADSEDYLSSESDDYR